MAAGGIRGCATVALSGMTNRDLASLSAVIRGGDLLAIIA
jgi:hypothetical protein